MLSTDPFNPPPREPVFNVPTPVVVVVAVLAAIHIGRSLLPFMTDQWVIWTFGFVPARFESSMLAEPRFDGGPGALVWTFVTYAFLHGDFTHLGFNLLWLLPFGSAVARRFGTVRFYLFLTASAIGGAIAHLVTHAGEVAPMIGASAAISGAMAAASRFAFMRGSFLGFRRQDNEAAARVPALPLMTALRNPRVITFVLVWFAMNILFGLGAVSLGGAGQSIAWQAHIGGFLVGLLLFSPFDPVPRAITPDEVGGGEVPR
jgi:membrane associated rhomboid family serine protease